MSKQETLKRLERYIEMLEDQMVELDDALTDGFNVVQTPAEIRQNIEELQMRIDGATERYLQLCKELNFPAQDNERGVW